MFNHKYIYTLALLVLSNLSTVHAVSFDAALLSTRKLVDDSSLPNERVKEGVLDTATDLIASMTNAATDELDGIATTVELETLIKPIINEKLDQLSAQMAQTIQAEEDQRIQDQITRDHKLAIALEAGDEKTIAKLTSSTKNEKSPAKKVKTTKQCLICITDTDTNQFTALSCGHTPACNDCHNQLIKKGIGEKSSDLLKCSECRTVFTHKDIRIITKNEQMVTSFDEILAQECSRRNPNRRDCPTPNCEHYFEIEDTRYIITMCPRCHESYCAQCLQNHAREGDGIHCTRKRLDSALQNVKDSAGNIAVKPCPQCNTPIEKIDGCNRMACDKCKYNFCWLCSNKWLGYDKGCPTWGNNPCAKRD